MCLHTQLKCFAKIKNFKNFGEESEYILPLNLCVDYRYLKTTLNKKKVWWVRVPKHVMTKIKSVHARSLTDLSEISDMTSYRSIISKNKLV